MNPAHLRAAAAGVRLVNSNGRDFKFIDIDYVGDPLEANIDNDNVTIVKAVVVGDATATDNVDRNNDDFIIERKIFVSSLFQPTEDYIVVDDNIKYSIKKIDIKKPGEVYAGAFITLVRS